MYVCLHVCTHMLPGRIATVKLKSNPHWFSVISYLYHKESQVLFEALQLHQEKSMGAYEITSLQALSLGHFYFVLNMCTYERNIHSM